MVGDVGDVQSREHCLPTSYPKAHYLIGKISTQFWTYEFFLIKQVSSRPKVSAQRAQS